MRSLARTYKSMSASSRGVLHHRGMCTAVSAHPALQWPQLLNKSLEEVDPELFDIIEHEKNRQYKVRIRLRGSEWRNSASVFQLQCLVRA
jgi:hypothetical protein